MIEEKITEEHKYTKTEDGSTETHEKVVEKETEPRKPEITTVVKETVIEED